MDTGPLVSIVIPVHNRAGQILKALRSLQAQTVSDWEAIVVDDGSGDDTSEVVFRAASDDRRIRLIRHDANRGAQAARNTGIGNARGRWIAFLDSDDQYLPESLEVRLLCAEKQKVSVVHSACYVVHGDGVRQTHDGVRPLSGHVYKALLTGEGVTFPGLLISRYALQRIRNLDENIVSFQEWDTAIRLAKHYRFGFVSSPTFIYDCRGNDTISKNLPGQAQGYAQVVRKHLFEILCHAGPRALAQHYGILSWLYYKNSEYRKARIFRRRSVVCRCFSPGVIARKLGKTLSHPAGK